MKPKQKAGQKEVMFVRLRFSEVQCEILFQKIWVNLQFQKSWVSVSMESAQREHESVSFLPILKRNSLVAR